ncbi:MAG: rRNA maturation RNase YbeY [Brevinematia bacterium]
MINILFEGIKGEFFEDLDKLSTFLESILNDFGKSGYVVSLVLSDNNYIKKLNRAFRGITKPTDVLSFPATEGEEGLLEEIEGEEKELGDIVISVEKAKEQAREYGVSESEELARLAIHGVLHLLGFDHEKSEEEEKKMFEIQDKYLESFLKILDGEIKCNTQA